MKYLFAAFIFFWCHSALAVDRCQQYVQEERQQHFYYFGLNFPYWYGVGQIKQESRCRKDVTAFDGGKGLSQFMPATEVGVEKYLGPLDLYNPAHAIKAQAWYMKQLHKSNWDGALWLTYCFYNSGEGTMRKEYKRSVALCHCTDTNYNLMRDVCKRRVLQLKSGPLDLCVVGYSYPKQIESYAHTYRTGTDRWPYWTAKNTIKEECR